MDLVAPASTQARAAHSGHRPTTRRHRQRRSRGTWVHANRSSGDACATSGPDKLMLGTMQLGELLGREASFALLSHALREHGVRAFDSAEMYPVPQRAATAGDSERIIGAWMRVAGVARDSVLLSTKATGPGDMEWIRGGPGPLTADAIETALDGSLRRMGTDYVDIYHLHWPDRYVPMFGEVHYDVNRRFRGAVPLEEQLEALQRAIHKGKVRRAALSNETPYGVARCVHAAGGASAPTSCAKVSAVQQAYSLLNRTFDAGLAETCVEGGVSLLAYAPLAAGLLSGKYHGYSGASVEVDAGELSASRHGGPGGARLNMYAGKGDEDEERYHPEAPNVKEAVHEYMALAAAVGETPASFALRFVLSHPMLERAVIGATCAQQLDELCGAAQRGPLDERSLERIDHVHARYPNPTP